MYNIYLTYAPFSKISGRAEDSIRGLRDRSPSPTGTLDQYLGAPSMLLCCWLVLSCMTLQHVPVTSIYGCLAASIFVRIGGFSHQTGRLGLHISCLYVDDASGYCMTDFFTAFAVAGFMAMAPDELRLQQFLLLEAGLWFIQKVATYVYIYIHIVYMRQDLVNAYLLSDPDLLPKIRRMKDWIAHMYAWGLGTDTISFFDFSCKEKAILPIPENGSAASADAARLLSRHDHER